MSFPTALDAGASVAGRLRSVARRTLRNEVTGRPSAMLTLWDDEAAAPERTEAGFALPTGRDDNPLAVPECASPPPSALQALFAFRTLAARGAEADLWRAERRVDRQACVVKLYFPAIAPDPAVLSSIADKPRTHFPALYAQGTVEGRYYEAMEHLAYGSMRDQLRFGPLDLMSSRYLLREVADALDAMHGRVGHGVAIIHGDIKPDNILLRSTTPMDYVLCDFGVSLLVDHSQRAAQRRRGRTPHYSAPELLAGQPSVASDFWALGVMLCEALAGAHPLAGLSADVAARRIVEGWQPDLPPGLPPSWQTLLTGLLQREPGRRWGGADVHRWLSAVTGERSASEAAPLAESPEYHVFDSSRALALYLAQHWETVAPLMDASQDNTWLDRQIAALAPSVKLTALRTQPAASVDQRLLRLIYRLAPDLPAVWKTWSVSSADVAALAARALRGDRDSGVVVLDLHAQDVLGELGRMTAEPELARLATGWHRAWADYQRAGEMLRCLGGPADRLPSDEVALLSLLRAVTNGLPNAWPVGDSKHTQFCCPWASPLIHRRADDLGTGLIASLLLPQAAEQYPDHLQQFVDYGESESVFGEPDVQRGWNPPVIAFSATHTPIRLAVCDERIQIGVRVHLSWNVSHAVWVYLLGVGRVAVIGEMERSDGIATRYSLLAVNATGYTVSHLPRFELPPQTLCAPRALCAAAFHHPPLGHRDLRAQTPYAYLRRATQTLNAQLQMDPPLGRDHLPQVRAFPARTGSTCNRLGSASLPPQHHWHHSRKGTNDERPTANTIR